MENEYVYDLIILGGGPAGLSAGLYAGRSRLSTAIIEKGIAGGQAATTYEIDNYPGVKNANGPEISEVMKNQAEDFGAKFITGEVTGVDFSGDIKVVKTSSGEYKSRAVIISTGAKSRKLGFPGEEEFTGRGVSYCATCDGEFFTELEVFVIGAGYAAAEEAVYLTRFAKKVTIIAREPEFTCAKAISERVFENEKIEVIFNTEIIRARGDKMVNYAKFINNKTGKTWEYTANENDGSFGIFVLIGYDPMTEIFRGHVNMDEQGYILTDENMRTDIKGVYAAGDLRPKMLRQVVTAVADGAIAATDAERYVTECKRKLKVSPSKNNLQNNKTEKLPLQEKKTGALNEEAVSYIKEIFQKMENQVTIIAVLDEGKKKSEELKILLEEIAGLGDKVDLEIFKSGENPKMEKKINADKFPVVAFLDSKGKYRGVKFHGTPGGHELNSFVCAISNLAGPGQELFQETRERIAEIRKKINVKIAVSLSCHYCPDVVTSTQRIAIENGNVEAEMIDILEFSDIREKYNIMSVPAIIIDDEEIYFGSKKIDEIVDILKK